ncbi:hypothetical protein LTS18_008333, partial [Coniosporium uncinatum]
MAHNRKSNGHAASGDTMDDSDPDISWALERPSRIPTNAAAAEAAAVAASTPFRSSTPFTDLLPSGPRSQSKIGLYSFALGLLLGTSLLLTLQLLLP